MNRILITGASGALGSYVKQILRPQAKDQNIEISTLTRSPKENGDVEGNFLDEKKMLSILDALRPDTMFHFAWETTHPTYWEAASNREWADATLTIAKRFAEIGGKHFGFAGTCAEYEWGDRVIEIGKTHESPTTLYGREKLRTSRGLMRLDQKMPCQFMSGRLFFPYSELENENRVTSLVIRRIVNGEPLHLRTGDVYRDICHTSDLAEAFVEMARERVSGIHNVATGKATHLGKFLRSIAEVSGRSDCVTWDNAEEDQNTASEPKYLVASQRCPFLPNATQGDHQIEQFVRRSTPRFQK